MIGKIITQNILILQYVVVTVIVFNTENLTFDNNPMFGILKQVFNTEIKSYIAKPLSYK